MMIWDLKPKFNLIEKLMNDKRRCGHRVIVSTATCFKSIPEQLSIGKPLIF